ncbi:MAG: uroporphyrinogen decarboxylase family protein [Treponema sp.]|nr:uroporphyrinogen decarboxylase family protein [Treponema sp.]
MSDKPNIETIKNRIAANWRLEDIDEVPFIIEVGPVHLAVKEYFENDEAELKWNEQFHRDREGIYDYAFPNIKPNVGINIIAAAFGCEYRVNNEADPWNISIIKEENTEDVYKLEVPDPVDNPVYQRAWKRLEYLQSHSSMPLRALNVPSPLVTASLIWDYTSFIEATLVFPDEIHALMEKVTEATILYIKEQFKRIKNLYSVGHELWYIPQECGVRVSDDTAALLSPSLYREFGVKYNSMISEAVGGIVVHSCGNVEHVVAPMMEISGLRGLDFTIPQTENWESIRSAAAGKTGLCLRHCYWDHATGSHVDMADYTKKILDFFGRKGLFIQTSTPTADESQVLSEKLHTMLSK